jgi:hypothetical protein
MMRKALGRRAATGAEASHFHGQRGGAYAAAQRRDFAKRSSGWKKYKGLAIRVRLVGANTQLVPGGGNNWEV